MLNRFDIRSLWITGVLLVLILVAIGGHFHDRLWHQDIFLAINHADSLRQSPIDWGLLTSMGETYFLVFILLNAVVLSPQSIRAIVIAAILGVLLSHGIKNLYDYPRPVAVLNEQVLIIGSALTSKSYISGHSVTAFVFLGLMWQWLVPLPGRTFIKLLVLLLALGICFSRIVVGAHWPMDTVFGALVGLMAAYLATPIAHQLERLNLRYFLFLILSLVGYSIYYCLFYEHINTASATLAGKWIAVLGLGFALAFRRHAWVKLFKTS